MTPEASGIETQFEFSATGMGTNPDDIQYDGHAKAKGAMFNGDNRTELEGHDSEFQQEKWPVVMDEHHDPAMDAFLGMIQSQMLEGGQDEAGVLDEVPVEQVSDTTPVVDFSEPSIVEVVEKEGPIMIEGPVVSTHTQYSLPQMVIRLPGKVVKLVRDTLLI
ncbi:hypothetical protein GF389_04605 [Candidatus Dojkabacteria bacterium]|nr:hypothetical protein [Candidatus Dojkabacteria bacterium]